MRKKHTKNSVFEKIYKDHELQNHIIKHVDNSKFDEHCEQVAKNLNIDPIVVKELLLNNSFVVLSLIQKYVKKNEEIKINITGFFSFITTLIKYKISHLQKLTKGRTY
jgi:hypothetical protein